MKNKEEYIELKFGPHWNYIAAARGFLQGFLSISTNDQEYSDKLAMAASELLENAVKYSENTETFMHVSVIKPKDQVIIIVINQSTEDRCKVLQEIYNKIIKKKPLEAYVEQMKEAAVRDDGKSQLGLVRIRYEVGADLKLDIDSDYKVTITLTLNKTGG